MKLLLARRLLAVLALLLAIFIIMAGIISLYIVGQDNSVGHEPIFSDNFLFTVFLAISAIPALGSYILWPK